MDCIVLLKKIWIPVFAYGTWTVITNMYYKYCTTAYAV